MKNILFVTTFLLLTAFGANAQKKLNLLIKYDANFERYEVFAIPNFSQKSFTWGPSQISVVLPSSVLVDKIQVRNVDGGTWEDNSVVIAPEVNPKVSFHGISSGGDKVDLVEKYESLLFYFTLPKGISAAMVKPITIRLQIRLGMERFESSNNIAQQLLNRCTESMSSDQSVLNDCVGPRAKSLQAKKLQMSNRCQSNRRGNKTQFT